MSSATPPLLVFAGICFAVAALVFLLFTAPEIVWRARRWSWKGWLVFATGVAAAAALYTYLIRILLR